MNVRDPIYVEHEVLWMLRQLVKASNSKFKAWKKTPDEALAEVPITVNEMASDILLQWVREHKPELAALYQRRKSIDDEAAELLKK
jgi:hypothetical protein